MNNPENKNTIKSLKAHLYLIIFFLGSFIIFQPSTHAQASLAAENRIDDIVVTTNDGEEKAYSVFRDAVITNQYRDRYDEIMNLYLESNKTGNEDELTRILEKHSQ